MHPVFQDKLGRNVRFLIPAPTVEAEDTLGKFTFPPRLSCLALPIKQGHRCDYRIDALFNCIAQAPSNYVGS